jgi:hypothetical protein
VEDLLHLAHPLEIEGPVEGRAEPQARDRVPDGGQGRRLLLVFRADGVLGREVVEREPVVDEAVQCGGVGAVLAEVAEQLHHVRGGRLGRHRREDARPFPLVPPGEELVGRHPRGAGMEDIVGDAPEVFEESDPKHAGPGPQLADGERREGLVGEDEAGEAVEVEVAFAVSDELEGHDVDAGRALELAGSQLRQLEIVGPRKVAEDFQLLALDQVEVVEQPFGRRRDRAALVDVLRDRPVRLAEHPAGFVEAGAESTRALAGPAREHVPSGEGPGAGFQGLSAQQGSAMDALSARGFGRPADPAESQAAPLMTESGRSTA